MALPVNTVRNTGYLGITILLAFFVWLAFSFFYPFDPLEVHEGSYIVQNPGKNVKRGEPLFLYIDYCKKDSSPSYVSTEVSNDNIIYTLPSSSGASLPGCYKRNTVILIPAAFPVGTDYTMKRIIKYRVNPFRDVTYEFITDKFNVI